MKKGAVLLFAVLFAACLFHFYYAEDHCPVHCPSRAGHLGHVHPHHAGAQCQCFWSAMIGPETGGLQAAAWLVSALADTAAGPVPVVAASDITPPPRPAAA